MKDNSNGIKKINSLLGVKKNQDFYECEFHLTHLSNIKFSEDDLDTVDGKWCCRTCEDYLLRNQIEVPL